VLFARVRACMCTGRWRVRSHPPSRSKGKVLQLQIRRPLHRQVCEKRRTCASSGTVQKKTRRRRNARYVAILFACVGAKTNVQCLPCVAAEPCEHGVGGGYNNTWTHASAQNTNGVAQMSCSPTRNNCRQYKVKNVTDTEL
jgi:hypothetical protein